jgi:hypothetical protein
MLTPTLTQKFFVKSDAGGRSKNDQFCHRDENRSGDNEHGRDQQKHDTESKKEYSGGGKIIDHSIITPKNPEEEKVLQEENQG